MKSTVFTVNLGFYKTTPPVLVGKGRNHVAMLTGNAAFPTPTPTLAALSAACDTLDKANYAYEFNRGKMEKEARDVAFVALKAQIRELGGYVQANCKGDKDLIMSAGFDVRRENTPVGPLPAPTKVHASVLPYPGRLEVRWAGVRGRSLYEVWMTEGMTNGQEQWSLYAMTTKNRIVAEDLTSNNVYTFRVVAVGPLGASPVSDITWAKAA